MSDTIWLWIGFNLFVLAMLAMIALGAALIAEFTWISYVFGAFLGGSPPRASRPSQRLLRRQALIRRLPAAVETLGSVTVICSDGRRCGMPT